MGELLEDALRGWGLSPAQDAGDRARLLEAPSLLVLVAVVVVLSLTGEWGVGIERQGPSYGEVVSTRDVRVQALLGGSNSPTSRSPEAVEWIMSI